MASRPRTTSACGSTTRPASRHSARRTDSNGFAARASACRSTRRTAPAPAPRTSIASSSSRLTSPLRNAESAIASASSNGSSRAQSITVRNGVVTPAATWSSARLIHSTRTPVRRLGATLRLWGTITSGTSGCAFIGHA